MFPHFRTCRHTVLFYRDEADACDRVVAYVEAALRTGSPALVIANRDLRQRLNIELHRHHVQKVPFGPQRGELLILDSTATLDSFCIDGRPDETLFRQVIRPALARLSEGGKRVAAYGDMVDVLCERGRYDEAVRLEQMWNELLGEADAALVCGYHKNLFATAESSGFYDQVSAAHAEVLIAEPASRRGTAEYG